MIKLTKNSQPLGTKPSDLAEGQHLEIEHAGVFYLFQHDYGHLDLIIGKITDEDVPENVSAIRWNDNCGLHPIQADAFWAQLIEQMKSIQNC